MTPGKDETRVCAYIRSEFIHWALWRTLMRTKYVLLVHDTTSILAKLSTWYFGQSSDISCSLLVHLGRTFQSWEGQNTYLWIYTLWIYSLWTLQNTDENRIFLVRSPHHKHFGQARHLVLWGLWWHQSLSTHYPSHTYESWEWRNRCLWIYTLWIYLLSTLENTDENGIFFIRSPHHKHLGKAWHLVLWVLWWHHLFSTH